MSDKPASPFAGLGRDKALLRSTREQRPQPEEPPEQPEQLDEPGAQAVAPAAAEDEVPSRQGTTQAGRSARKRTGDQRRNETSKGADRDASSTASKHASMLAREAETAVTAELIETIRKAVKVPGKEVSFSRLTPAEKSQLADIVYTYKRQGKKTSENEINRIALNFILEDYRTHGEHSILARVIESLLA